MAEQTHSKFSCSCLKADKNNFKATKTRQQKMVLNKKKSQFEEGLAKNRNKPK